MVASTYTWIGTTSNDWTTTTNWNGGLAGDYPGTQNVDIALINAGSATPTISASDGTITLGNVTISSTGSATVAVSGVGAGLVLEGGTSVSIGGTGQNLLEALNGGTIQQSGSAAGFGLGVAGGATGTLIVSGTSSALDFGSTSKGISVGGSGAGYLTVSNSGSIQMSGTGGLVTGTLSGGTGTITIATDGLINMGTSGNGVVIGQVNTGSLDISGGGGLTIGAKGLIVGATSAAVGTVTIEGAGSTIVAQNSTGSLVVGGGGSGVMTINAGGAVSAAALADIGTGGTSSSSGSVTVGGSGSLSGGTLSAQGFDIATTSGGGTGVLTILGGGLVTDAGNSFVVAGSGSGTSGTIVVNSGSLHVGGGALDIGASSGTGSLLVENSGSVSFSSNFVVGNSGTGVTTVQSGGQMSDTVASGIIIGDNSGGSGSLVVNGGTFLATSEPFADGVNTALGVVLVENSGGSLAFGSGMTIGNAGTGSLTIQGGAQVSNSGSGGVLTVGEGTNGNATVLVNGGTLLAGNAIFTIGSSVASAQGNVTVENSGSLSLSNSFIIGSTGTGTVSVLSSANVTDTGTFNVDVGGSGGSGVLLINGGTFTDTTGGIFVGNTTASGQLTLQSGVLTTGNSSNSLIDINATGGSLAMASVSGGTWNVDGQFIIGDTGSGTLAITGGTVNAGSNSIGIGNQSGGNGSVTIIPSVSAAALDGGSLEIAQASGSHGTLVMESPVNVSNVQIGSGGSLNIVGVLTTTNVAGVSNAGRIESDAGKIIGSVTNTGTIIAESDDSLVITGSITGTGFETITGSGTTLEANGIGNSQSIAFDNTTSNAIQLDTVLSQNSSFQINNWDNTDELIINNGSTVTGYNWAPTGGQTGTLTVDLSSGGPYTFSNVTLAAGTYPIFQVVGTNAVELISCFATGTLIETADGPVPVEELSLGDLVLTADDATCEPIIWIGQRSIDCAAHPRPLAVWPVRIQAGAFGPGTPARDLWLSPDHAVFVDGVLVPVKLLLNDTTIRQIPRDSITWFHVELPRHAVILAERLPVESYLDTGDRARFSGGPVVALYPDFAARTWEMAGCAELVTTGARLEAVRAVAARFAEKQAAA